MCGACGRRAAADAWSQVLGTTRARWEVARAVDAQLRALGTGARVGAGPAGWVLRDGTGACAVAGSATELWTGLVSQRHRGAAEAVLAGLRAGSRTDAVEALVRAGEAVLTAGSGVRPAAPGTRM